MVIKKIKKGWPELNSEIINTGKCVLCGACSAFCLNIKYDMTKEVPIENGSCKDINTCRDGFGVCYNLCPKTEIEQIPLRLLDKWVFGKETKRILGHYIEINSVKLTNIASEKVPLNAGVTTLLLTLALEEGLIDAAIVTGKDDEFKPYPYIAEKSKDLIDSIGYKPSQSPTLSKIGEAINKEFTDIAVVGTPCQIQALRKLQNHPHFDFEAYDMVSLAIGTFCFGTFHNDLLEQCYKEFGIKSNDIQNIITDKYNLRMKIITSSGVKEIPLNLLYDKAIRKACFSCSDYTASFADISIGDIGSEDNWKTVIIRTQKGKQLFDLAVEKGMLKTKSLQKDDEELVLGITRKKIDIIKIKKIIEHSSEIKSFILKSERIAKSYKPGMFVILWIPDIDFLPMSISKVDGDLIEITVQKIGEGTSKLFEMKEGDTIGIRGPFGNSWNCENSSNILIVGGGMGIAALTSVIEVLKKNNKNIIITIGAKDKESLIFADRIIELLPNTLCTTDDGSRGRKCYVTETIDEVLSKNQIDLILTCGPEAMMKKVVEIAESKGIKVQASLERKMKCGIGLCGSCCIGENNDICVCKDGPIFSSEKLVKIPQFGTYSK
ncbi:MAG: dihydroorotate dehydrogenase electron transfer subunit [Promethearchaeota archaeon]